MVAPFLAVGAVVSLLSARGLNSIALGDELAAGLGEHVAITRRLPRSGRCCCAAPSTAVCGPIAFVGLVVPHACRLVVGPDYRWVMPLSAVAGAIVVTVSDTLGRIVARPDEIDVGIITALGRRTGVHLHRPSPAGARAVTIGVTALGPSPMGGPAGNRDGRVIVTSSPCCWWRCS